MKYDNVKVLEINPVVYLGEDFKNNDWKENQKLFKEKISKLEFNCGICYECPIEDMISIQVDYEDKLEPLAKKSTIDKIFSVINELIKVFKENVKINLHLDDFIEGIGNSVDMDIQEFANYLLEETKRYEAGLN